MSVQTRQVAQVRASKSPPLPPLLTLKETAHALRVSPATVGRMVADGRLHATRLRGPGSSVRVPLAEVARLLAGRAGEE